MLGSDLKKPDATFRYVVKPLILNTPLVLNRSICSRFRATSV